MKNTTKNVTSETKSTVKPVEKPVATKTEKPVATKPVEKSTKPVKTNTEKVNKLYSFDEVMKLFDPNADKVEDGQEEGFEQLSNPIEQEDMSDDELEIFQKVINKKQLIWRYINAKC